MWNVLSSFRHAFALAAEGALVSIFIDGLIYFRNCFHPDKSGTIILLLHFLVVFILKLI
jgi:hypothetical protein